MSAQTMLNPRFKGKGPNLVIGFFCKKTTQIWETSGGTTPCFGASIYL